MRPHHAPRSPGDVVTGCCATGFAKPACVRIFLPTGPCSQSQYHPSSFPDERVYRRMLLARCGLALTSEGQLRACWGLAGPTPPHHQAIPLWFVAVRSIDWTKQFYFSYGYILPFAVQRNLKARVDAAAARCPAAGSAQCCS